MQTLDYSTNRYSKLNEARRALWAAKEMLGAANQQPDQFSKSFWMTQLNYHRNVLRNLAHKMRAEL